mgnify:CR=1 FL=1
MDNDNDLSMSSYDIENYWSTRALYSNNNLLNAVCVFRAADIENRSIDKVQRYVMRSALNQIDLKGKNILEYGCGVGRWINFFQEYGCSWNGVDISREMLTVAKNRNQNAHLKKIGGKGIPYMTKSFDLVYAVTVLHHNTYKQQETIISEMIRVLKDNGLLILFEDIGNTFSFKMFPRSASEWIALGEKYGLVCIWQRSLRYCILKSVVSSIKKRVNRIIRPCSIIAKPIEHNIDSKMKPFASKLSWRGLIGYIDFFIDPYLLPLIPNKYKTTAIMVFKKKG